MHLRPSRAVESRAMKDSLVNAEARVCIMDIDMATRNLYTPGIKCTDY